jgi:two-component system chemotaxis response regulator CheY
MKLHGGQIRVFSEGEGRGCTFSMDIPIARIQKDQSRELRNLLRSILTTDISNMNSQLEAGFLTSSARLALPLHTAAGTDAMSTENHFLSQKGSSDAGPLVRSPRVDPVALPSASSKLLPAVPILANKRIRAIVIDDSDVNRKMMRRQLREFCKTCDEAVDGVDGVEKVLQAMEDIDGYGYDIVITDYMMPRMNGIEVVEKLRAAGYAGIIMGLTGNTETSMMNAFERAGANRMLIKPINGKVLQEIFQSKDNILCVENSNTC